jgi:hypothetical protein
MKVLDGSPVPYKRKYVNSAQMTSDHLKKQMPKYRKLVEEERKQAEDKRAFAERMGRPEEWA